MLLSLLAFAAGLFVLWLLFKLIAFPIKILWKLLINAIVGAVILLIFNLLGGIIGVTLAITPLNALVAGILGVPGVIILLIVKFLL